jgi:hypothetical protein
MNHERKAEFALLYELARRPLGFGVAQLWMFEDLREYGLNRRDLRAAANRLGLETCTKNALLWWRYPCNVIPFVPPGMSLTPARERGNAA